MEEKQPDIFDIVRVAGAEAARQVDELGYAMLAKQGYDVTGWDGNAHESQSANERIKAEMEKRGEWLNREGAKDNEMPRFAVWLSLYRGEELVARSEVIQLVLKEKTHEKGFDS